MSKKKKKVTTILPGPTTSNDDLLLRRRQVQRKVIEKILAEIEIPQIQKQYFSSGEKTADFTSQDEP